MNGAPLILVAILALVVIFQNFAIMKLTDRVDKLEKQR